MTIAGIIDQSANIKVINNFTLENSAEIKGTLVYESNKEFDLSEYKGLQGGVEHKKIQSRSWFSSLRLFLFIWSLIAALIVGYVMAKIWPYQFIDTVNILIHSPGRSAIYGFIVFILTPLIAIVSMLLVVTIPASLILLGIYFIALYLAKIYTGGVIGHLFYRSIGNQDASIVNKMIVGILILYIFLNLPVVGDLVLIGSMILGLGGAFQILIYGIHLRSKIAKSV